MSDPLFGIHHFKTSSLTPQRMWGEGDSFCEWAAHLVYK